MPGNGKKASSGKKRKSEKKGDGQPTKKPTRSPAAAPAARLPTRSAAENDRLKKEKEGLKGENEALKKELSELKNNDKSKADRAKLLQASVLDDKVFTMLRNGLKNVYNSIKFIDCEDDESLVMSLCLEHTTDWPKIKALDGADLDDVVKSYVAVYGQKICKEMNRLRSGDQSTLRKIWIDLRNNGTKITSKQFLKVAVRDPKYLQILDEKGGTPEENKKNKELNQANEKYRERFELFISRLVPSCTQKTVWCYQFSGQRLISEVDKATAKELVPAEAEAMVIVFLENNEKKWEFQSGVIRKYGNVTKYEEYLKELLKKEKREAKPEEEEPDTKFTSSNCGPKKYGGWNPEGRARYQQVLDWIQEGRRLDTTEAIEEQARKAIEQSWDVSNEEEEEEEEMSEPEEESESEEEGEAEDPDEEGYVSVDSAEEIMELEQYTWDVEKKENQAKKEEEENKKKAREQEKEAQEKKPEAAAAASDKKDGEMDDGKNKDGAKKDDGSKSGGSTSNTSTSTPPTGDTSQQQQQQQQQQAVPEEVVLDQQGQAPPSKREQPSRKAKGGSSKQG